MLSLGSYFKKKLHAYEEFCQSRFFRFSKRSDDVDINSSIAETVLNSNSLVIVFNKASDRADKTMTVIFPNV